jgi:hypothetical protein
MTTGRLETCGPQSHAVHFPDGRAVLFSYATPVAAFVPGRGYLKTETHHSVTTSRHVNAWAGKDAKPVPDSVILDSLNGPQS